MPRFALMVLIVLPLAALAGDSPPAAAPDAEAIAAFAARDFEGGVRRFRELAVSRPDDPRAPFWEMMVVRGLSLRGMHPEAAEAAAGVIAKHPDGPWTNAVRFLMVDALVNLGEDRKAAETALAGLAALTAPEARARVADLYLRAADRAFTGGSVGEGPFRKAGTPEFVRALRLYRGAREIGVRETDRPLVAERIVRSLLATKAFPDAAREAGAAIEALPEAPNRAGLMSLRAVALVRARRAEEARRAVDLMLDAFPGDVRAAGALLELGDLASLRLVRDRLADAPEAPVAAWRAASLIEKGGDAEGAITAFALFLKRYPAHDKAAEADFRIAEILLGTGAFDDARQAFSSHRERHPMSSFWTRARARAVDASFLAAKALRDAGDPARAFDAWRAFAEKHPLDARIPGILLAEGDWHREGGRAESAYAVWDALRSRYGKTASAPVASLRIGQLFEETVGDVARAVTEYRALVKAYPKSKPAAAAKTRLAVLRRETLTVRLPRAFRSDEEPYLEVVSRNVGSVTARIYDIDIAEYFRRHRTVGGLDDVLVDVIKPDDSRSRDVPEYESYREISWRLPVPRSGPGAAIVVIEGGALRAVTLVLVSDVTVVTKEWRHGALAFVQDARTGEPVAGVEILAAHREGGVVEAKTGADGVVRVENVADPVRLLAVHGGSVASDEFEAFAREVRGRETLVHITTDRPLYRPGHEVAYRAIVRRRDGDAVENPAGAAVLVRARDRLGNTLHENATKLSAYGTVHGRFLLPPDLPPGDYDVRLTVDRRDFTGRYRVEEYVKPDVLLSLRLERDAVIRGETVKGTLRARYAFGKPIAGLRLRLTTRGGVPREIVTDAAGEAAIEVAATRVGPMRLLLTGRDVARRRVALGATVMVGRTGYGVTLSPDATRLSVGQDLVVTVTAVDPLGDPVAREGTLRVLKARPGSNLFGPVLDPVPVACGEDGLATVRLRLTDPGRYRLRYEGRDRRGGAVTAQTDVEVVAAEDLRRVHVKADRERYVEGETATVAVRPPGPAHALVTLESERVHAHRIVRLPAGSSAVPVDLDATCVPNVRIRVALIHDGALWTGGDHVRVTRHLKVELTAGEKRYRPGDLATVHVKTTDARGEPVSAELGLAVVDEAIYALREDTAPHLIGFFTPPEREDLVRTGSSLDFLYEGVTTGLSRDLLAERERRKKPAKDAVMLDADFLSDAPFEGPSTNAAIGIGGGAGGGFRGRGGRRQLRAEAGGGTSAGRDAAVRKDFADTAHWSGALVTGPDGKATVTFKVPDNLTTWRITGRAASTGGAFGDGLGSFVSAKALAVLVAAPPVMRDGDTLIAAASIHNDSGRKLDAQVDLEATEALYGPFAGTQKPLAIGADAALDWRLEAPRHGRGLVAARARAGDLVDAEQRTVRVLPYGVPLRTGTSGMLDAPVDWRFTIPEDVVPGTLEAQLRLAPSVTAQVLTALDHLDRFPYGCVEQTVNRFYPALMAAKALKALGRDEPGLRRRLDAVVVAGIRRLTYLQLHQGRGGWSWWRRGKPSSYMTAYAALSLAEAKAAGYAVPDRAYNGARTGLEKLLKSERDEDLRAFLRYALVAWLGKADLSVLSDSYARRSKLTARGLAWLALAYARQGATAQVRTLAEDLRRRIDSTDGGARVRAVAAGRGSRLEASALALRALLAARLDLELTDRLAIGLATARQGGSFGSTIETGAAVLALTDYLLERGAGEAGFRVEVRVNDAEPMTVSVTPVGAGRESVATLVGGALRTGTNRIRIRRLGAGRSAFSLAVTAVVRSTPTRSGSEIATERRYALQADLMRAPLGLAGGKSILRPGGARREPDVSKVAVGDVVRVTLETAVRPGLRYVQIEDPIPAGFAALQGTTTGAVDETVIREDRIVFFVADPPERLKISYLMRAGFPGRIRVPPARAFPMYRPAVVAYSAARAIDVGLPGQVEKPFAAGLAPETILAMARSEETDDPALAARLTRVLLERFDLTDEAAREALLLRARASERGNRPADVVDAYDRLTTLSPGDRLGLEDVVRLARAAAAVGRHADVIEAVRRAAAILYGRDRRSLTDLPDESSDRFVLEPARRYAAGPLGLAGRYPFGPRVEADLARFANAVAYESHDFLIEEGYEPDAEGLAALDLVRALYPTSPTAGHLALRHARSRLRAGAWAALEKEAPLAAELYPDHTVRAEADWFHAYALFAQGRYEDAVARARESLARKTYVRKDGSRGVSVYRRNLLHLLAQTHHVQGELDQALSYYRQLAKVSPDASAAVRELTETRLSMPARLELPTGRSPKLAITTKNQTKVDLRVYPIDLLSYFALRKNLSHLHAVNLDGLEPAQETTVDVAGHDDRREHVTTVALDLAGPGVYLVLARAGESKATSVVILTDLVVKVWSVGANRSRVRVTDTKTGKPVRGAHVKVARGSAIVAEGVTDARGLFDTHRTGGKRVGVPPLVEEEPDEIVEVEPGEGAPEGRVMVVVEKDGHAAAWW